LAIRISIQKAKLEIDQINSLPSFEFAQPQGVFPAMLVLLINNGPPATDD
jgi:hypothetical protein